MVVPRVSIHEGEELVARCRVDHLIYDGQREADFGAGFVQVGEEDADFLFSIFLLHQKWIGEPVWVKYLSDEVGLEKSVNFVVEGLETYCVHLPWLLFHWFNLGENG